MTAIATRLNFRVRPETERRLRTAAAASNQSLTDFVISAAEVRADEVLASHTVVPAEYFEALLEALDEPPQPNDALIRAVRQRRRFKRP